MSKELNALLERIQKPENMKAIEEAVPVSAELSALLKRVNNRKWREIDLIRTLHNLQALQEETEFIEHLRKCKQCQAEMHLSIERYWGSRGPWYLNLQNEIGFPEIYEEEGIYKTCPRLQNYKIGYYGHSSQDTIRFIMDRIAWAEKIIKADVEILVDYYLALENWDLEDPAPIEETTLFFCF